MTRAIRARRSVLADDLRGRVFRLDGGVPGPARVGVELELLPVDAGTGRPLAPDGGDGPSTGKLLRGLADGRGWRPEGAGAPGFELPDGGRLTFEPGGQIEYSSAPAASVGEVLDRVEAVVEPLRARAADAGIELVCRGIDPENPPSAARRVLHSRRYTRLADHLARIGPAGRRMMLQTAAVHVNLDLGDGPGRRWRVANALTPYLLASFANSARYRGRETGFRSYRARQWRELDVGRSGVFAGRAPVEEYLDFALGAGAILLGEDGEPARPFRSWLAAGRVDGEAWSEHLSTLFPEVRPRGYLEIRSLDALPPRWLAAPLVFLAGILYDDEACRTADELLPPADDGALERAGRLGVGDAAIRRTTLELWHVALEGARRCGPLVGGRAVETARAFRDRYPARGRDPAGDPEAERVRPGP